MPALIEQLLPMLRRYQESNRNEAAIYLIKSDGMNHQKFLGFRAMELIEKLHPELIHHVHYNSETGWTTAACGKGRVNIVV